MRKIFFGIAIELFAVLLQLSLNETVVSLIIGSLGLLAALFGLLGTGKNKQEVLNEQIENEAVFQFRQKKATAVERKP